MKLPSRYRRLASFVVPMLLTLTLTELALRLIFALPALSPVAYRLVRLIGDANVDDTKQRLLSRIGHLRHQGKEMSPRFHPHLGLTAAARTRENPFGIRTDVRYLEDEREKILFFGDSFVEGYTASADTIPCILDQKLKDHLVLNFGVRGYGLDQMYLYLRWAVDELKPKHVLIGVLYADINRLLFQINQGPKPFFELDDGELVLRGVPISTDREEWLQTYSPNVKSYLFSAGQGLLRRLMVTRWATQHLYHNHPSQTTRARSKKQLLARRLTEKIREICRQRAIGLTFVLFPQTHHLIQEGWEELFMRDLLQGLAIDYVDMQGPLTSHIEANGLLWWRDVYTLSAHPDQTENQLMADAIHGHLCRKLDHESCSAP